MSSPFYATNDAAIARRWMRGSPTILWVGDSISAQYEPYIFRAWPVTPAGWGVRGGYGGLGGSIPAQASATIAGKGVAGILAGGDYNAAAANYNITESTEILFTGSPLSNTGGAGFENRLWSIDLSAIAVIGDTTRALGTFAGTDWLNLGSPLNIRTVYLKTDKSVDAAAIRFSMRNDTNNAASVHTAYFDPYQNTPTLVYAAADLPFSSGASGSLVYECQFLAGLDPAANDHFITCHSHITTGEAGMTIIPINNGGWSVANFSDETKISQAAWSGILPHLGITDIVIALTTNSTASTAQVLALVAKLRAAAPDASITFLSQYDVNDAGSGIDISDNTDHHYAAHIATDNSQFLNLYRAGGTWTANNDLGFFSDGLHPTSKGSMYFLRTIWSLLVQAGSPSRAGIY